MALLEKMSDFAGLRLETDRLVLRELVAADVDRLVELIGDYEVTKWLSRVPWPYRRDHALEWVGRSTGPDSPDLSLAIDDGSGLIGSISLKDAAGEANLGYWLGRPYWARGYMSEAATAFLSFVFGELAVDTVHSSVFDHNVASLRLQERFGFKVTGRNLDFSLARGNEVPGVTTQLTRADFETFREPVMDYSLNVGGA